MTIQKKSFFRDIDRNEVDEAFAKSKPKLSTNSEIARSKKRITKGTKRESDEFKTKSVPVNKKLTERLKTLNEKKGVNVSESKFMIDAYKFYLDKLERDFEVKQKKDTELKEFEKLSSSERNELLQILKNKGEIQ